MVIEMLHSYKKPSGDSFNTEKSPQTISKHLKNIPYKQKNKALTFKMQGLCTYIHKHIQCKMWALFHRSSIVYGWIMDRLLKCISLNGLTFSDSFLSISFSRTKAQVCLFILVHSHFLSLQKRYVSLYLFKIICLHLFQ